MNLVSPISLTPAINFIEFVPSVSHQPLHIQTPQGTTSKTGAFLIPQWGGVHILNAHNSTKLSSLELQTSMQVFRTQLRELLGVPTIRFPSLQVAYLDSLK
jgi:phosphatidylinositol glycan class S